MVERRKREAEILDAALSMLARPTLWPRRKIWHPLVSEEYSDILIISRLYADRKQGGLGCTPIFPPTTRHRPVHGCEKRRTDLATSPQTNRCKLEGHPPATSQNTGTT